MVLQLHPTKAERSPSPVKEVFLPQDRTPRDCRQALTCRLPNQNQTRAQRASPSMGPSKPDKEAPELQPTGKGEDQTHDTTENHTLYTTLHNFCCLGKHIATIVEAQHYTRSSAALLESTSSREELLHTCDTRFSASPHSVSLCRHFSFCCFLSPVSLFVFFVFFSFFLSHYNFLLPSSPLIRELPLPII